VAPSYYDVRVGKDSMTVTVVGYPARYRNFRRNTTAARNAAPFSVKQLPGGATALSYDKSAFSAKLASDDIIAIQAIQGGGSATPAVGGAGETGASAATSTIENTGE